MLTFPQTFSAALPALSYRRSLCKPAEILHSQFKVSTQFNVSNLRAWGKKKESIKLRVGRWNHLLWEAASSPHTNLCPFLQTPFSIFPLSSPLIAAALETLWGKKANLESLETPLVPKRSELRNSVKPLHEAKLVGRLGPRHLSLPPDCIKKYIFFNTIPPEKRHESEPFGLSPVLRHEIRRPVLGPMLCPPRES